MADYWSHVLKEGHYPFNGNDEDADDDDDDVVDDDNDDAFKRVIYEKTKRSL